MNLKREIFKCLFFGGALAICAVMFGVIRAPLWVTITTSVVAVCLNVVFIILFILLWRKHRSAPELSFSEFGFLWETWKASDAGIPEVFADTPSQKRLAELGLIKVVSVKSPNPTGLIPSPMGDVTFTFSEITPLGRRVLRELARQDGADTDTLKRI
jgi:hypothetical protein